MIVALAIALVVTVGIPYVVVKHLGVGIHRRGRASDARFVALTFDDGPDPIATPRLLASLRRHGAKATFFVSGDAARAHPQLVRQLIAEGHDVGSHGFAHRHALFERWPLAGFFDTRRALDQLDALLGRRTRFFRPPFGAYSWSVLLAIWIARVQPVNWSVESHDWHPRYAPSDVVTKILDEARPGAVIVMHDGGRGAEKSVPSIEPVLLGLAARGLVPVPLSYMELQ